LLGSSKQKLLAEMQKACYIQLGCLARQTSEIEFIWSEMGEN